MKAWQRKVTVLLLNPEPPHAELLACTVAETLKDPVSAGARDITSEPSFMCAMRSC